MSKTALLRRVISALLCALLALGVRRTVTAILLMLVFSCIIPSFYKLIFN